MGGRRGPSRTATLSPSGDGSSGPLASTQHEFVGGLRGLLWGLRCALWDLCVAACVELRRAESVVIDVVQDGLFVRMRRRACRYLPLSLYAPRVATCEV